MKQKLLNSFKLRVCLLVAVMCSAFAGQAWADTTTYQHVFNAKPSTGSNITLSGVSWTIAATNLGNYNSGNYAGVQLGTSSKDGEITLTTSSDWGSAAGTYKDKTIITEVRIWLNKGGTSVTPSVTIGGKPAISDGTTVVKNSSAGSDWTKATKVTFTPAADGNTGVVVINVATVKAGYICAMEIDCEEAGGSSLTASDLAITGAPVALSFDLYNTSSAQTVSFTTSSTGAVTVSESEYVETSVSGNTITVTPVKKTPSAQTITVSQAADATYAAGSATFTVEVANSDPNVPGSENNPYTVAQAIANTPSSGNVYIHGIVSSFFNTSIVGDGSNYRYYISDDGETTTQLLVYKGKGLNEATFTNADDLKVGDEVTIFGSLITYSNAPEVASGNYLVSWNRSVKPIINASDVNIEYNATSGSINFTVDNPVEGGVLTADITAGNEGSWLSLGSVTTSVPLTCTANEGNADRTATVTLTYTYNTNETVTKTVTVTQAHYVVDYATLPFNWEGGLLTDFDNLTGTSYSLNDQGSYAESNAPYRIKFTNTGDYLMVKTDSQPGKVTIGVKMTGGGNTSSITVQESSDGQSFSDVEDLSISGAQNSTHTLETSNAFGSTSRYVRLYFTKGSNVGVGPITIAKVSPVINASDVKIAYNVTSSSIEYSITNPENGSLTATVPSGSWLTPGTAESSAVPFTCAANEGEERTETVTLTYTYDTNKTVTKDVTVTQAGKPFQVSWTAGTNTQLFVFAGDESEPINNNDNVVAGTTVMVSIDAEDGYTGTLTVKDASDNDVSLTTITEGNYYSFTMPASNVTITSTAVEVTTNTYTLATAITSGKHYVIASGNDDGDVKVMGTQNSNNRAAVDGIVSSNTLSVTSNAGAVEFVIYGPDADNHYTIYDADEVGYLYAVGGTSSNHLKTETTPADHGHWTISLENNNGENGASLVANITGRNTMRYNSGSTIFSCYSGGQSAVYLYEKSSEDTPTESKTLNGYGYATYCSQNALDFTNNSEVSAWIITAANSSTGVITFSQIEKAPAGTGMLLKGDANATVNMTAAIGKDDLSGNLLEGTTSPKAVNDNEYYGLSGNTFVKVNAGVVPAGKALLPASEVAEIKAFTFIFESADGIKTVEHVSAEQAAEIFNLAGQRLQKAQRGVNIINGKKVLVK